MFLVHAGNSHRLDYVVPPPSRQKKKCHMTDQLYESEVHARIEACIKKDRKFTLVGKVIKNCND